MNHLSTLPAAVLLIVFLAAEASAAAAPVLLYTDIVSGPTSGGEDDRGSGSQVPRMAGITGNSDGSFWVGNSIHDIQGSGGECDVRFAGVRFNTTILSGAKIGNNSFFNSNQAGNSNYGALTNDWNLAVGSVDTIFWRQR